MSSCGYCQKPIFLGLKCKDCKYICHRECEDKVAPSCGLPQEYLDEFKKKLMEGGKTNKIVLFALNFFITKWPCLCML